MEGVEDHWLDDYWDNEWRRLLLPFQNQAKFKRNNLLRNPDPDELYLMNNQYPPELIKTALIPARKTDVSWLYQSRASKDWKDLLRSVTASVQWRAILNCLVRNTILQKTNLKQKETPSRFYFQFYLSETFVLFEIPLFAIRNAI